MDAFTNFPRLVPVLAVALTVLMMPVYGQISTPCTASVLTTFTPCMNFITNSSANGTSPSADCCNSLKSMTNNGMDCLCLIATGSVPFQIPINRSLAISLPRACNTPGVPLQCKASSAPIPAPGPVALGPTVSPPLSPTASTVPNPVSPVLAPESDKTPDLSPASPTVESDAPTSDSGIRPVLNPSASKPSHSFSPLLLLAVLGATVLKNY
ncbi:non-specific lipid transfer protein GPI-anchored 20-like [Cornus florida]|uniref:non-specific lipid transfer protein GPI-anchored 20-like n=1 Tax=Cornus florida TaxID=4283 RepID=UPI00289F7BBC|nr:non-specific lipid transfer protein GPI-anchored 20-like [Cornus florida]